MPLLDVQDLTVHFNVRHGLAELPCIRAVDGVSFSLEHGMSLGLVGESGCGKTTLG
ncbi:MAG: ATP-binding cassette domain-containing protein, partial [bacterium]